MGILDDTDNPVIEGVGINPDVVVLVNEETVFARLEGRDPVLEAAVDYLNTYR